VHVNLSVTYIHESYTTSVLNVSGWMLSRHNPHKPGCVPED